MKTTLTILLFLLYSSFGFAQERPEWVRQRPINTMYYTGIARVEKSETDYMTKAKAKALRDLISEIKVTVSTNSLLKTLEENGVVTSDYEETVKIEAGENIESYELIDSWQNDSEYWVYYQLNKFDYEEYITQRREKAIREGFDFWYKGEVALLEGNLMTAIEFFLKGLEAVQSVANEELTCEYEGETMDVGRELYASLNRVFNGISIVATPNAVEGRAFQGVETPVKIKVSRNSVALKNLNLKYSFVAGEGKLSENTLTDDNGEVDLYVRNITSKLPKQEICIALDATPFATFKNGVYKGLVKKVLANSPRGIVYVNIGQTPINAYVKPSSGTDVKLKQAVQRILTNSYFNIVSTPGEADILIELSSDFRKGEKTAGGMRDFITYYTGAEVSIVNNRSGQEITDFALTDIKVLQASTVSLATAKSAATRELIKRMQRGLKTALKEVNISTEGTRRNDVVIEVTPPVAPIPEKKPDVKPDVKPVIVVVKRKVIEGEFIPNLFIRYIGMKQMPDRTILTFSVINRTEEDHELYFSIHSIKVINEKGEKVDIVRMKMGSSKRSTWAKALVVKDVPTPFVLEVKPIKKAVLVQIEDSERHVVKLRNIQ